MGALGERWPAATGIGRAGDHCRPRAGTAGRSALRGAAAAPLTALEQLLPHFDAVINTIPAPVLGAAQLRCLPRGALILDLASRPGGTDFAAARELGLACGTCLEPARPLCARNRRVRWWRIPWK